MLTIIRTLELGQVHLGIILHIWLRDLRCEATSKLRVRYFNKETKQKLIVTQQVVSVPIKFPKQGKEVILKNGLKAIYIEKAEVDTILFKLDNILYSVITFKKDKTLSPEQLLEVTNSLSPA